MAGYGASGYSRTRKTLFSGSRTKWTRPDRAGQCRHQTTTDGRIRVPNRAFGPDSLHQERTTIPGSPRAPGPTNLPLRCTAAGLLPFLRRCCTVPVPRHATPPPTPGRDDAMNEVVRQGLYDPRNEHDACGVGFVVN